VSVPPTRAACRRCPSNSSGARRLQPRFSMAPAEVPITIASDARFSDQTRPGSRPPAGPAADVHPRDIAAVHGIATPFPKCSCGGSTIPAVFATQPLTSNKSTGRDAMLCSCSDFVRCPVQPQRRDDPDASDHKHAEHWVRAPWSTGERRPDLRRLRSCADDDSYSPKLAGEMFGERWRSMRFSERADAVALHIDGRRCTPC